MWSDLRCYLARWRSTRRSKGDSNAYSRGPLSPDRVNNSNRPRGRAIATLTLGRGNHLLGSEAQPRPLTLPFGSCRRRFLRCGFRTPAVGYFHGNRRHCSMPVPPGASSSAVIWPYPPLIASSVALNRPLRSRSPPTTRVDNSNRPRGRAIATLVADRRGPFACSEAYGYDVPASWHSTSGVRGSTVGCPHSEVFV